MVNRRVWFLPLEFNGKWELQFRLEGAEAGSGRGL